MNPAQPAETPGTATAETAAVDGAPATKAAGRSPLARIRNGRSALTLGLLFDGVASYVFLTASGRALGPDRFATVSVLWVVLFLVGNGLFIPVEQELGRSIAARRARGQGSRTLVVKVNGASGVLLAVVCIGILLDRTRIADSLFRGEEQFVLILVLGIVGVWLMYLVRGFLAGSTAVTTASLFCSCAMRWPRRSRRCPARRRRDQRGGLRRGDGCQCLRRGLRAAGPAGGPAGRTPGAQPGLVPRLLARSASCS